MGFRISDFGFRIGGDDAPAASCPLPGGEGAESARATAARGQGSRPQSAIRNLKSEIPKAFTLIEGLIATVVLGLSVVGILSMVSASHMAAATVAEDGMALTLARSLGEELAGKPFAPGPNPGWSAGVQVRAGYDDAFDYHGYTDTTTALTTIGGTPVPAAAGGKVYTRAVTVTAGVTMPGVVRTGELALVTVTVTPPTGGPVVLRRLISAADPRREDA